MWTYISIYHLNNPNPQKYAQPMLRYAGPTMPCKEQQKNIWLTDYTITEMMEIFRGDFSQLAYMHEVRLALEDRQTELKSKK